MSANLIQTCEELKAMWLGQVRRAEQAELAVLNAHAEVAALRAESARLREALEAILSPDHLLNASPEVFGGYAARRMQAQAHAALHPKEETP